MPFTAEVFVRLFDGAITGVDRDGQVQDFEKPERCLAERHQTLQALNREFCRIHQTFCFFGFGFVCIVTFRGLFAKIIFLA